MYRIVSSLLLVLTIVLQPASATPQQGPDRFADGTLVPEHANFSAPEPVGGSLPLVRYPKQLAAAGVQGHFEADVVVSATGDVLDVVVKQRVHRQLDQGLVKLLRQLEFTPARLDDEPYQQSIELPMTFRSTENLHREPTGNSFKPNALGGSAQFRHQDRGTHEQPVPCCFDR